MSPYPLTKFEIQKDVRYETEKKMKLRYNGVTQI